MEESWSEGVKVCDGGGGGMDVEDPGVDGVRKRGKMFGGLPRTQLRWDRLSLVSGVLLWSHDEQVSQR